MSNVGRSGYVTVDTTKARRVLKEAGKTFTKSNRRVVARESAKILRDDMRQGAGGIVPKYKKAPYHTFSRINANGTTYKIRIKSGNLRKSILDFSWRRSGLMWVGPRYMKGLNSRTIGETHRTSDGFYDKWYIRRSGNDFAGRSLSRNAAKIKKQLMQDTDSWLKKIVAKAHATP